MLLKKDNLGDGRLGIGMKDFGGEGDCDCDDCEGGLDEDLALREDALVNDDADFVRFFELPPGPLPALPRRR